MRAVSMRVFVSSEGGDEIKKDPAISSSSSLE